MRTLVTNGELLCRIQRAFASRRVLVRLCADVAGRVQRRARIASGAGVCVRACARSARTRDRHASRISIGRCACASLRERTMKRPRNRVERSTPLTTIAITREWKNREYDRTRSASKTFSFQLLSGRFVSPFPSFWKRVKPSLDGALSNDKKLDR